MSAKQRKIFCSDAAVFLLRCFSSLAASKPKLPPQGVVPDEPTAVKIAEAVLTPVYGNDKVASEQPFKAELKDEIWTVSGTLHCPDGKGGTTTLCDGGVAVVEISKVDAHVISMVHYK